MTVISATTKLTPQLAPHGDLSHSLSDTKQSFIWSQMPRHDLLELEINGEILSKDDYLAFMQSVLEDGTHEATVSGGYKRTLKYQQWRANVVSHLLSSGYEKEARKFWDCAENPRRKTYSQNENIPFEAATVWVCESSEQHSAFIFMPTCDCRICPDCARRRQAAVLKRLVPKLVETAKTKGRYRLRHIVLTTPISLLQDDLGAHISEHQKSIRKFWKLLERMGHPDYDANKEKQRLSKSGMKKSRYKTLGTVEAFEFGTEGLKLHSHIMHFGTYLPQNIIKKAWMAVTGGTCEIVYVNEVAQRLEQKLERQPTDLEIATSVGEVLKYATKFWKTNKQTGEVEYVDPALMPRLHAALKGKRRIVTRGIFYNLPELPPEPFCCEECGNEMTRIGLDYWDVWLESRPLRLQYGATWDEVKIARGLSLNLKLANKSPSHGVVEQRDKPPPLHDVVQKELFRLDDIAGKPNWHYEND